MKLPRILKPWRASSAGELIRDFDWSHDGKQVVVARGHLNSNVVLISNFH
jgi:hypothetical protein